MRHFHAACRPSAIAKDLADPDALWITEARTDRESHKASRAIPEVAETIKKAMPLIAGFDQHIETEPWEMT